MKQKKAIKTEKAKKGRGGKWPVEPAASEEKGMRRPIHNMISSQGGIVKLQFPINAAVSSRRVLSCGTDHPDPSDRVSRLRCCCCCVPFPSVVSHIAQRMFSNASFYKTKKPTIQSEASHRKRRNLCRSFPFSCRSAVAALLALVVQEVAVPCRRPRELGAAVGTRRLSCLA